VPLSLLLFSLSRFIFLLTSLTCYAARSPFSVSVFADTCVCCGVPRVVRGKGRGRGREGGPHRTKRVGEAIRRKTTSNSTFAHGS